MTKIDKQIKNVFISLISVIIIIGLLVAPDLLCKLLGLLLGALYVIFIISHLGLLVPLIMLFFTVEGLLMYIDKMVLLRTKSEVLFITIKMLVMIPVLIFMYYILPIIIIMLFEYSIDFKAAQDTLREILNF